MSYRDLRNFTEMMRALGYPRLISIENFRTPNFPLVAEVLKWLVKRYDPNVDIPTDIDTEQDRVIFIKSVAQFMATKAHIKLNTKKLYMSDGYAVKELVKVTSVLYNAMKTNAVNDEDKDNDGNSMLNFDITSKVSELKQLRQLASVITEKGASLYDHLSKEVHLRELRTTAIARPMEINEIERSLKASIRSVEVEIKKTNTMLENVASDEANLEAKIEKKKSELERNEKRLRTLQSVRPAYMDEYEKLEDDLKKLYEAYMEKYRNLSYLENQLEEFNRTEQDKLEETEVSLKRMQHRLKEEEKRIQMSGIEGVVKEDEFAGLDVADDDSEGSDSEEEIVRQRPPRVEGQVDRTAGGGGKMFGSMTGGDDSDNDDSDDEEIDVDDDDMASESEDEIGQEMKQTKQELDDSDNDF